MGHMYFTHHNRRNEADNLVVLHHYSGRPPSNVQQVITWHLDGGLFGGDGPAVAACYFSIPPTRWSEEVWELSRLVRTQECDKPLTALISEASKIAKKNIDLLVSFADYTQNHHGGIYQAASWHYDGLRDKQMDGVLVGGTFIPGRSCNSKFGTRSPAKLAKILNLEVMPHYDEGKHLYWKPLNAKGRRKAGRLGLQEKEYPKPDLAIDKPPKPE